jgi:hypothetical protein
MTAVKGEDGSSLEIEAGEKKFPPWFSKDVCSS